MSGVALEDLRLFCRIVELGSLRAAALEARADPSRVTRRLTALEAHVRGRLIVRSRVRSAPTEAGQRYYAGVKAVLERLDAVEHEAAGLAVDPRGTLKVAAPSVFGARHVGPWLHALQQRWPELAIELVLGDSAPDLVEQAIDVAIRIGALPDSSLTVHRLGVMSTAIVAAPEYLRRAGTPRRPEDLERHRFVLHSGPLQPERLELTGQRRTVSVECRSTFEVSSILGVSEAVRAGAGLNAGPLWLYADALARRELIRVLPAWSPPRFDVSALTLPGAWRPAKIDAALALLRERVAKLPGVTARR